MLAGGAGGVHRSELSDGYSACLFQSFPLKEFTILSKGRDKEQAVPLSVVPGVAESWCQNIASPQMTQPAGGVLGCGGRSIHDTLFPFLFSALALLSIGASETGDVPIRMFPCLHSSREGGDRCVWALESISLAVISVYS